MEIYFDDTLTGKLRNRVIQLRHNGHEDIFWEQRKLAWTESTFRDINAFWRFCPNDVQEAIFLVYRNLRDIIDNAYDLNTASKLISEQATELYKLMPLSLIDHWMRTRSDIRLPADLKTELQEDDRVDQTYLEPDYRDLTVLSIALKPMAPIWGDYMAMDTALMEMNKDIFAINLLDRTEIVNSPAFLRFKEFVQVVVKETSPGMGSIINGIGSVDIPEWMLAFCIVSKLSVLPLSHSDDEDQVETTNLISKMWGAIRTQLPNDSSRGKGDVKPKMMANDSGGDEDNLSTAESYKVRESISDGERIAFDAAAAQIGKSVNRLLGDDHDRELLKRQLHRNLKRQFFNPNEVQLKLVALVMHRYLPTRALPHTERNGALGIISLAQVYLHQHGFSVLADLLGADPVAQSRSMASSGQLKEEQLRILDDIYQYHRYTAVPGARTKPTLKNPGVVAVNALYNSFGAYYWKRDVDAVIAAESTLIEDHDGFLVPPNFKQLLADFIIFINTDAKLSKP